MKISHLSEISVAGDPGITQNNQQSPRFGRHPTTLEQVSNVPNIGFKSPRNSKVLEKQVDEMTAGCVATVAQPLFTQSRTKTKENSITNGIKSSKKFANSPVTEDELSEEQLLVKQLQHELFKKAKLRDIGKPTKISDVLLKKQIENSMFETIETLDEIDNDFWYHGPHTIARECYYNTNNPNITVEDIHSLYENRPPKHINVINNKPYMDKPDVASVLEAHKELVDKGEIPINSQKVFQNMGQQLIQIATQADRIKHHSPEEIKKAIVDKLEEIDDPRLTHATKTLLQKTVEFNRKHPKIMAAVFGLTFAIIARVSMEVSHRLGLSPTQATLIIEATLPTLGNLLGYLVNGFSVKDSVQSGLIAGAIGVTGTLAASGALRETDIIEGDVVPFKQKNPLTPNLIKQLKALSQQALELFWEGSYMPTAAQGQIAQLSKEEQSRMFKQNESNFKSLGYEYSINEEESDILYLHSIAREQWYDSDKPANQYRGLPDLMYNQETNTLSYYDLIGDDGYEYTDTTQF